VAQLEALYRERYERFARVAGGIVGDGETGRDAVQHAFAVAIRERTSFRGDGSLEGWLWRIVLNEARRLASTHRTLPLVDGYEQPMNGHSADEYGLRSWIATLPERQRAVLFLRYQADMQYSRIAEVLGVDVGTVSATLSAAHTKLRKAMTEVER
jgi:RNA polymerase sigma factor (sigma-70 family)